jgi:DNA-binding transcriptional LysR family regulator
MRTDDLAILDAIVQYGSVTKAARFLHRVPSGLTARIKELEKEVGKPLFTKEGRALVLTEAGTVTLEYARQMLALEREMVDVVSGKLEQRHQSLRLGSLESTAAVWIAPTLAHHQHAYPNVWGDKMTANQQLKSFVLKSVII